MKTCRTCLQMNVKVSFIGDTEALKLLQEILSKRGFDVLSTHYICVFCKHLLNKFLSFIQKIIKAQSILKETIKQKKKVQVFDIQNKDISLFSYNLSYKKIDTFFVGDKNNKTSAVYNKMTIKDADILEDNKFLISRQNSIDLPSAVSETLSDNEDHKPQRLLVDENIILPNRLRDSSQNSIDFPSAVSETLSKYEDHKPCLLVDENIIIPNRLRDKRKKQVFNEFREKDSKADQKKRKVCKIKRSKSDDDYNPGSNLFSDDSSDSSEDEQYDDNGRRKRQRSPARVYPRTCEECSYQINSKTNHFHHYLSFHKDKEYPYKGRAIYLCKFCGKSKTTAAHLRVHELTHGKPTLKCKECNKMFTTNIRLKRHQIYHEAPKYECDYCHKNIHTKPDLMRHIRTHTGEKPFKCHICGEAFAHKGNVGIHMRNRHQQEPTKKGRKPNKKSGKKKKEVKRKKI